MAVHGGTGRIGYFVRKMQIKHEYTVKDIKKFFADNCDDENNLWSDITYREAKNVLWGLIRSECYVVQVLDSPKRVKLLEHFKEKLSPIDKKEKQIEFAARDIKYNTLLSSPFNNINLS